MSTAATPLATHTPAPPADTDVVWFGASRRRVGSRPDAQYGWLDLPRGPCIVKAMDRDLVAYNATMLDHERHALRRLAELQAPVPALVDVGRPDWLVTAFAGLSLQRLCAPGAGGLAAVRQRFPLAEQLAVWQALLRALQPLDEAGVLVLDLYPANVVVPLTGLRAGQLKLREVMLIDHANTLVAGMATRRPIWLKRTSEHVAPELRDTLRADQQALFDRFRALGADAPGVGDAHGARAEASRRAWAQYSAPQALQQQLDAGRIDCAAAMQFSVGVALQQVAALFAAEPQAAALRQVARRMAAAAPQARYPGLAAAADALARLLPASPKVGHLEHPPLGPAELRLPEAAGDRTAHRLHPDAVTGFAEDMAGAAMARLARVGAAASLGAQAATGSPTAAGAADAPHPAGAARATGPSVATRRRSAPRWLAWWPAAAALGLGIGLSLPPLPW